MLFRFSWGTLLLTGLLLLIYFGAARHVLDRMHMRDRTAAGLIAAMIAGSFVDIPISSRVVVNVGGIVTVGVAIYLWVTSGTAKEKLRSLAAAVLTGAVLYAAGQFMDASPEAIWLDPMYLYPLVAGVAGYLFGRSRRGAFFAAVLGVLSMDGTQYAYLRYHGIAQTVHIGGAGMFDSLVIAAVLAVLLADFVGEAREFLQGGPSEEGKAPELLENLRFSKSETGSFRQPTVQPIPAEEYRAEAARENGAEALRDEQKKQMKGNEKEQEADGE